MSTPIRRFPLDQAQPGMVLAADVTSGGNVLLPLGTVLSASQLDGLAKREVREIVVLAPSEHSAAEIVELRKAQERRVQQLFRRAGSDATMQALLRVVLEYRLEGLE